MNTPLYTAILAVIGSYGLALIAFYVWAERQKAREAAVSGERVIAWPGVEWQVDGTGTTDLNLQTTVTVRSTPDGGIEVVE